MFCDAQDHLIEINEIKAAIQKTEILMAPYHRQRRDQEHLDMLAEELGCISAAKLLEPEIAARASDLIEKAAENAPETTEAVEASEPDECENLYFAVSCPHALKYAVLLACRFCRGQIFVRRVRQKCVTLLLRDIGGEAETGGQSWPNWLAHLILSSNTRVTLLLWFTDAVLSNIDTQKLERVVHRFHVDQIADVCAQEM
eukprot:SAG31_NODE_3131_length_4641_cov_1.488771_5_plen_200_part_00